MHYIPLRKDWRECWPKVLQVNHQIHDEAINLLHKDKSVEIQVDPNGVAMCSRKYRTQHFKGQEGAAEYFKAQLVHFTSIKLSIGLTLEDIIVRVAGRHLRSSPKFMQMKLVVSELAHRLADREDLKDLEVAVQVHFDAETYAGDLEVDVADLLADWGVRELIGKSAVWLLGPFNQIHNLEAAKFSVGVTGMLCPL
jgi:hypothetical protein